MQHNPAQAIPWRAPNPNYVSPKLTPVDPLTWADTPVPERRWIVRNWIPHGAVTMLSGDGGAGKSLLAQQLATCAVAGRQWLEEETLQCHALYIACEDDTNELHRRQAAINQHYQIGYADVADLALLPRVGDDNLLMEFGIDHELGRGYGAATEFYGQVHNLAQDHGAQLIVLDSLHDVFGGNENARPQARQFINLLRGLAIACDGAVVLCAHPSLAGLSSGSGLSGSTAWSNTVRSRVYLTRPNDDHHGEEDERVLRRVKANYSSTGDEIRLCWQDGVFISIDEHGGTVGAINRRTADQVFLELLAATTDAGRHVSDSANSANYAPRLFAKHRDRQGFKVRDFDRAMERLFSDRKIVVEPYGPPSTNSKHIVALEE